MFPFPYVGWSIGVRIDAAALTYTTGKCQGLRVRWVVMVFLLVIGVGYVQDRHVRKCKQCYNLYQKTHLIYLCIYLHTVVGHKSCVPERGGPKLKCACLETSSPPCAFSNFSAITMNIISSFSERLWQTNHSLCFWMVFCSVLRNNNFLTKDI